MKKLATSLLFTSLCLNIFGQLDAKTFAGALEGYHVGAGQTFLNKDFRQVNSQFAGDPIMTPDSINLTVVTYYTPDKNNFIDMYYNDAGSVKYLRLNSFENVDTLFDSYVKYYSELEGYSNIYKDENTFVFKKDNLNTYILKSEDGFIIEFGYNYLGTDYIEMIEGNE
ncbi:MAG: hypothetical protein ACI857_002060 [Arenicella sp.]|jgi:hypothetical protein